MAAHSFKYDCSINIIFNRKYIFVTNNIRGNGPSKRGKHYASLFLRNNQCVQSFFAPVFLFLPTAANEFFQTDKQTNIDSRAKSARYSL
mmetsp:Transcript_10525/g.14104  ORF Transcript_10525/g.14104 Transcript_10525/m.14104 type:complete len:89 (-) Transcript_10525:162-428(-)